MLPRTSAACVAIVLGTMVLVACACGHASAREELVVNNLLRVPCDGGGSGGGGGGGGGGGDGGDACRTVGSSNCARAFFPQRTCLGPHRTNPLYLRHTPRETIASLHARQLLPPHVTELPRVTV